MNAANYSCTPLNTCTLIKIYILQYQFKLHIIILNPTGNMVSITHDLFWLQQNYIRSSFRGGGYHQPHALNTVVCLWHFRILSRDKGDGVLIYYCIGSSQDICYFPRHYQPRDLWSYSLSLSLSLTLGAGPNLFSCSRFNLYVVKFNHWCGRFLPLWAVIPYGIGLRHGMCLYQPCLALPAKGICTSPFSTTGNQLCIRNQILTWIGPTEVK